MKNEKFCDIITFKDSIEFRGESMDNKNRRIIAITGSTGGLGKEICSKLVSLGEGLILVDRNIKKSEEHKRELLAMYPNADIKCVTCDLEDMDSVKAAVDILLESDIDVFIHNAGAYKIPRRKCSTGFDNAYQINFVSPYYMIKRLLSHIRSKRGRVVAVGSIAHNYSKINANDVDFSNVKACSKVYGNAKRYLMFALWELFKGEKDASLSIVHPGITVTNITAHYHPLLYAIIKYPMKVIFMPPKKAALSIIDGVYDKCDYLEWIGPRFFDIWGIPKKKILKTCSEDERKQIFRIAEDIYEKL